MPIAQTTEPGGADKRGAPIVRFERVTKRFGNFTAVDQVSLDIYPGEVFSLLGGSGSGKSTLLRMLAGLEDVSEGRIMLDGVDLAGVPPYARPVNMMFQSYALFPHMSVEQNIAYGLKEDRLPRSEIKDKVADILALVQLSDFSKRKPHQLSGGQRQRVALARALVKRPKVLLLDEPLGALDKKLREETQFELLRIQQDVGITFIVVTHDQEEAMTLSDRVGVMDQGKIVQTGTPEDLYEHPNSCFTAGFLGSVNLFEGEVIQTDKESAVIHLDEFDCDSFVDHGITATIGQKVTLALRPEKIRISKTDSGEDERTTTLHGTIEEVAYLGHTSIFRVIVKGKSQDFTLRITEPNLSRHQKLHPVAGDKVYLCWDGDASRVLTQ